VEVGCGCGSVRVCGECACMYIWYRYVSGSASVEGVRSVAIGKDSTAQYTHIPVGMENRGALSFVSRMVMVTLTTFSLFGGAWSMARMTNE